MKNEIKTGVRVVMTIILGGSMISCGRYTSARISATPLSPDLCWPTIVTHSNEWATSCDQRTAVNIDSGERIQARCPAADDARIEDFFEVESKVVAVVACLNPPNESTTVLQSMSESGINVTDIELSASVRAAKYYQSDDSGFLLLIAGKCDGLMVFKFKSKESLEGELAPISMLDFSGQKYELDGGRSYTEAAPCSTLSAVRALGTSADGRAISIALSPPSPADYYERPIKLYTGKVTSDQIAGLTILSESLEKISLEVQSLAFSLGVIDCDRTSITIFSADGSLRAWGTDGINEVRVDGGVRWGGFSSGQQGKTLLLTSEANFEKGRIFSFTGPSLCP